MTIAERVIVSIICFWLVGGAAVVSAFFFAKVPVLSNNGSSEYRLFVIYKGKIAREIPDDETALQLGFNVATALHLSHFALDHMEKGMAPTRY